MELRNSSRILFLVLFYLNLSCSEAEYVLRPGDIAFVQYNADTDEKEGNFAFVALADIPADQVIYFTDKGWNGKGFFETIPEEEGIIIWTCPAEKTVPNPNGGIRKGTVVEIFTEPSGKYKIRTRHGNIEEINNFHLSPDGDQVLAYLGSADEPYFIAALNNAEEDWQAKAEDKNSSQLPKGLLDKQTALALGKQNFCAYTGDRIKASKEKLLKQISNTNAWTGSNSQYQITYERAQSFYEEENITLTRHFSLSAAFIGGVPAADLTTKNGETYAVYLNESLQPMAVKVDKQGNVAKAMVDTFPFRDDLHHGPVIGIDGEGYIHIVGNMHSLPSNQQNGDPYFSQLWRHWISKNPYDISSFEFVDDDDPRSITPVAVGATYVKFRQAPNGKLYLTFRGAIYPGAQQTGKAGTYTAYAVSYDSQSRRWKSLGGKAMGPFGEEVKYNMWAYEKAGVLGKHYQPMQPIMCIDTKTGRLHMITVLNHDNSMWPNKKRDLSNGFRSGTAILYGYSDDEGETWHKADGTPLSMPTNAASGDIIDSITPGQISNGAWIGLLPDGRPVVRYSMKSIRYRKIWNGTDWGERLREPFHTARYELDALGDMYLYDKGQLVIARNGAVERTYCRIEENFLVARFDKAYHMENQMKFLAYSEDRTTISLYTLTKKR